MKRLLASFSLLFLLIIAFFVGLEYVKTVGETKQTATSTATEVISADSVSTSTPAFAIIAENGIATSVVIDFGACLGTHTIAYAFGSSRFSFKGPVGDTCAYLYNFELEMGKGPTAYCYVPMRLGKKAFTVNDMGIDMGELAPYCSNE